MTMTTFIFVAFVVNKVCHQIGFCLQVLCRLPWKDRPSTSSQLCVQTSPAPTWASYQGPRSSPSSRRTDAGFQSFKVLATWHEARRWSAWRWSCYQDQSRQAESWIVRQDRTREGFASTRPGPVRDHGALSGRVGQQEEHARATREEKLQESHEREDTQGLCKFLDLLWQFHPINSVRVSIEMEFQYKSKLLT